HHRVDRADRHHQVDRADRHHQVDQVDRLLEAPAHLNGQSKTSRSSWGSLFGAVNDVLNKQEQRLPYRTAHLVWWYTAQDAFGTLVCFTNY
ncbi:hypothetical protein, partial [Acidithiobacillus thiooxidans]|uniref:hypothetical protein n=1 Tax=Acidithiobacillus thiooxidans TaxID=930 RepID=UPI001F31F61E